MASSKVLASSNSRNSDLSRKSSSASSKPKPLPSLGSSMTVDGLLRDPYDASAASAPPAAESSSTLLDAEITLLDAANSSGNPKTVDEVWGEIVSGGSHGKKKECKEEAPDVVMTLEDFLLAKTGGLEAAEEEEDEEDVKNLPLTERLSGGIFAFDPIPPPSPLQALDKVEGSIVGFGNGVEVIGGGGGRVKRGRSSVLEPLDKAAQQRQRRMIKNRESAARSRERKQAYQVELESLAVRLEEEHEQLLKEKAERTKERLKQLMEKVIPIEEERRPRRALRRIRSFQW